MSRTRRKPPAPQPAPLDLRRFVPRLVLWLLPAAAVWALLTPFYNRFLVTAGENLVRLTERPPVTRLAQTRTHYAVVARSDFHSSRGNAGSLRVTDVHFPLILLGAFFLAVPGVPWRRRLENLGWAVLLSIFFHLISVLFWVKFIYATQLGEWSAAHYGPWSRNFWGLGKHLLDLPFKFAWPLALWCAFYLRLLQPAPR
ncbi:MAG: hypothetical protein D6696_00515 [Acidobacteria bacterium]|nr:MAG: hypothetical protein D6696_00515 [Acidobacteriota bacterium]